VLDHGRPFSRRRGRGGGHVEEIGAADPLPADLPLTSEERSAYVGSYHLTGDVRASFQKTPHTPVCSSGRKTMDACRSGRCAGVSCSRMNQRRSTKGRLGDRVGDLEAHAVASGWADVTRT
jgi:hypothetical protein